MLTFNLQQFLFILFKLKVGLANLSFKLTLFSDIYFLLSFKLREHFVDLITIYNIVALLLSFFLEQLNFLFHLEYFLLDLESPFVQICTWL